MTEIAFIGLGTMGCPMAGRLIRAGHTLRLNRVKEASRHLIALGGRAEASPALAAEGAEVIILMLPDTPDVEQVLFGSGGVASSLSPGALVIDMSSIDPVATREFAKRVREQGGHYLDAPVSGGEIGAKGGTLSIMVGGEAEQFNRALPLFEILGKNINLIGENGAGQVAKVANQIIVALTIEGVSEALLLAQRAGVAPDKVRQALLGGFAQSRILEVHGQRIIDKSFSPGFAIRLHRKDLNLAANAARALQLDLPNTTATLKMMDDAVAQGNGDRDHSALFLTLEAKSAQDAAQGST
ncbi:MULTISPECIES: 2-hydroxy-3-oxopropionate reductase [Rhizobium]|uniref:2-hydroxy-3-oxopropionate reductase n=1 Tax=Rhizobium hidalgonense TaxID=1538159 RepID=A0AAJ2GRR1_9HYPH|nr:MULTISPECIES: 2-hydroxy-3-oxopropionate reductase [Rhizobium]ANK95475.1 2-hydroxy-3-oxopropionate reductase [Rhizobium sp. N6212]ANL01527.1 2-hydroxy-3-oxopropionate reductase [Rhizobium sp. N621]ANL07655.1 2-hydroxy-3-oxopropionate reductase [Rhizobium esperanzae]ANL13825.1 2-hydroxy-3-oxopropionate reductase [Rhizobium sp. N1341]ANL25812.1 2-hydroxy-3-oxopropionate reductase [Rhizobium sp. N113]